MPARRFRGSLAFASLGIAATAEFQRECFCHPALATRLAFGFGKALRQFGDPLLLYALVFSMLFAGFR